MDKSLDEALKIFLLNDSDLRMKAEIEGMKEVKAEKYKSYDREFKNNFVKSFAITFIEGVEANRKNLAYTLVQNKYPEEIVLKAGRITQKEYRALNVKENKADILMKYYEKNK